MTAANTVFAVPVFFIVFRETIETSIIVAVLLAFLKQTLGGPDDDAAVYRRLRRQVWVGTAVGLGTCLVIGCGMIGAFYGIGEDVWSGTENLWEGIFSLLASVVITIMGAAILRVSKLQAKWQTKLSAALTAATTSGMKGYGKKYAMLMLPLITVLREGLEAIVFVGGVSFANPASSFPLPVVVGILAGCAVGWAIYRGGDSFRLQWFLIASTCLLYLVAAGLLSKAAWAFDTYKFEQLTGGDASESGSGPGSYDIRNSVWHVNCCSPTSGSSGSGGGWGIFNSILGWQNSATYGSVIWYNVYWILVSLGFLAMKYREQHGRYPFLPPPAPSKAERELHNNSNSNNSNNSNSNNKSDEESASVNAASKAEDGVSAAAKKETGVVVVGETVTEVK